MIAVDPELGRIQFAADVPVPTSLQVSYWYGFPAQVGGGPYDRTPALASVLPASPGFHAVVGPAAYPSLESAVAAGTLRRRVGLAAVPRAHRPARDRLAGRERRPGPPASSCHPDPAWPSSRASRTRRLGRRLEQLPQHPDRRHRGNRAPGRPGRRRRRAGSCSSAGSGWPGSSRLRRAVFGRRSATRPWCPARACSPTAPRCTPACRASSSPRPGRPWRSTG